MLFRSCNFKNRIIDPLHSRCTVIDFKANGSKAKMATQFFQRVCKILEQENIETTNALYKLENNLQAQIDALINYTMMNNYWEAPNDVY